MFELTPAAIGLALPVMFLVCAVAIVITSIIVEGGKKELRHKEVLLAMEKGIEPPHPPVKKKRPRYLAIRAWGLVLTLPSIGLIIGLIGEHGIKGGVWGLIPLGLGGGLLLASHLEKKEGQE